jgi:quercetin dioxygenase-like cupin family protein
MLRTLLTLAAGIGAGMAVTFAADHNCDKAVKVTRLSQRDIIEKLDGKEAKATVVEVTLGPGQAGQPHRDAGPVFGYVLEGEYELGLDDQPTKMLKAGETFYEATGCLHRVSRNPAATGNTRVLAVVLHPRDARQITTLEPKK